MAEAVTENGGQLRYVTLSGVPLRLDLHFPFRPAQAGSDWSVLHGRVWLDDVPDNPLHVDIAVNMSATFREMVPSLERIHSEPAAINAVRKAVDEHQVEFLKSGKMQPVPLSSRQFSIVTRAWSFSGAKEAEARELLKKKVYWASVPRASGETGKGAWIADPVEAQYLNSSSAALVELATGLGREGWLEMQADHAIATPKLMDLGPEFRSAMEQTLAACAGATKIKA